MYFLALALTSVFNLNFGHLYNKQYQFYYVKRSSHFKFKKRKKKKKKMCFKSIKIRLSHTQDKRTLPPSSRGLCGLYRIQS